MNCCYSYCIFFFAYYIIYLLFNTSDLITLHASELVQWISCDYDYPTIRRIVYDTVYKQAVPTDEQNRTEQNRTEQNRTELFILTVK